MALCLFLLIGCNREGKPLCSSPGMIPDTHRQMNCPGFWIARNPSADKLILDPEGIALFNLKTEKKLKLTRDVSKTGPVYSGEWLVSSLREEMNVVFKQKLYSKDAKIIGKLFYREMEKQANVKVIPPEISVRYGFICNYADQRFLPTEEIITQKPGDLAFDELQNSSLDIGVPLAILHESKDGLWVYAFSPTSSGWIKKSSVVFCGSDDLKAFLEKIPFVVVINAKADIFLNPGLTGYLDYVRMGAKFPFLGNLNSETAKILIPAQTNEGKFIGRVAYLKKADVNLGYLSYTPRNIIQQAFKLLNAPYSWGGKGGEQDCSGFIQEVFSTVGVLLPRNSSEQSKTGKLLGSFAGKTENELKMRLLDERATAGITILQLKGHILLYLGMFENRPYAIHDTYGYSQKQENGPDIVREINRVVVSELSLGKGSRKGSLFERIISIREIN